MRLLVLGGTQFVGRHFVDSALARGHHVTLFHRGRTNRGLFPGAEEILGDRDGGLAALGDSPGDGTWDVVVDVCGYVPRLVTDAAARLRERVPRYAFVSTISVYDDRLGPPAEDAPQHEELESDTEEVTGETYGPLKVACERVLLDVYPDALLVRPGVVVGPHDPTHRFTYWPVRMARGGTVAAPGNPDAPVQFVDARDLADWTVAAIENDLEGPYNIVGPARPLTMRAFLEACRDIVDPSVELVWLPDELLEEDEVSPFTGLPFWLPEQAGRNVLRARNDKALAAGLELRDLARTIEDTLDWHRSRPNPEDLGNALSAERESELLGRRARRR